MKKIYNPDNKEWAKLLKRPTQTFDDIEDIVKDVFRNIELNGDDAVQEYTNKFDKVNVENSLVGVKEIKEAVDLVSDDLKRAIILAKNNIDKFHRSQKSQSKKIETSEGVICWQEKRAIQKVGLYIPGGTAPLFSTILMLAVPAKIAGCEKIILCSPPNKEGKIHPAILYAANLCGIEEIYKIGGIQAIAAMTFGTNKVPKVYKIFGPGNQYVTVAKQVAQQFGVAIDMPAGPSELLVVTDESANASFVASDLLSQAEHGKDSQVILVSTSKNMMDQVEKEVILQLEKLPRKEIAQVAISNSKMFYCKSDQQAIDIINEYAPEHFIICSKNEDFYIEKIQNVGSVFIGSYTPESAGDYASGTNHTLPTNAYAKNYNGVNLDSFLRSVTFQKISKIGIQNIGPSIELMADAEGLHAHKNAVSIRLNSIANEL